MVASQETGLEVNAEKINILSYLVNRVRGQITTTRQVFSDFIMVFSILQTLLQPRRHRLIKNLRGIAAKVLGIAWSAENCGAIAVSSEGSLDGAL